MNIKLVTRNDYDDYDEDRMIFPVIERGEPEVYLIVVSPSTYISYIHIFF